MFCPECGSEYRDGIERCSDCNVALVQQLTDDRPLNGLMLLATENAAEALGGLLDRLEKAAVPYVVEAGTALSMLTDADVTLEEPEPWEARVWVAQSFTDRAKRIVEQHHAEYGTRRSYGAE